MYPNQKTTEFVLHELKDKIFKTASGELDFKFEPLTQC